MPAQVRGAGSWPVGSSGTAGKRRIGQWHGLTEMLEGIIH